MGAAAAGWYPDTNDLGWEWYWDGAAYTQRRLVRPSMPPPPSLPPRLPAPAPASLVPAVCTKCGGQLEVDPSLEAAICPFCRTPYIVEQAIQHYEIEHTSIEQVDTFVHRAEQVHVERRGAIGEVVGFFERHTKRKQAMEEQERRAAEARRQAEEERDRQRPWLFRNRVWPWFLMLGAPFIFLLYMGLVQLITGAD